MARAPKRDPKREALARDGALNPHPEAIHDASFTGNPFFDAQGRVVCGLCGERMGVRYHQEHGRMVPIYICQETSVRCGGKVCQTVPGKVVDTAVANLMIELMTPMTLAVTLDVQRELKARTIETDALRRKHVERLRT